MWRIGGYFRQHKNFTYITTPKSGHFMPMDNYNASKSYLDDYMKYGELICHTGNCSVSFQMCEAMNQCNAGHCLESGACACPKGFKGADCSFQALNATSSLDSPLQSEYSKWFYINHETNLTEWNLTLTPTNENVTSYNIYILRDVFASPNQFNFDVKMMNLHAKQNLTIVPGVVQSHNFSVALEVEYSPDTINKASSFNLTSSLAKFTDDSTPFIIEEPKQESNLILLFYGIIGCIILSAFGLLCKQACKSKAKKAEPE